MLRDAGVGFADRPFAVEVRIGATVGMMNIAMPCAADRVSALERIPNAILAACAPRAPRAARTVERPSMVDARAPRTLQ